MSVDAVQQRHAEREGLGRCRCGKPDHEVVTAQGERQVSSWMAKAFDALSGERARTISSLT
ncbi:MAG: hypothetical protein H6522_05830 [Mycolicibacterium sp.]|nr:hypothetical protein [Mycolicibacterium sp.]